MLHRTTHTREAGILAVMLLTVSLLVALAPPAAAGSLGEFFYPCTFSHRANDDPIVYPGRPGASNSNDFVGNNTTDANSTATKLYAGTTTCRVTADKSAYWYPTLLRNGVPQQPSGTSNPIHLYYRDPGVSGQPVAFPFGLKVIEGNQTATSPQANWSKRIFWQCGDTTASTHYASPPDCPGSTLTLMVRFPYCWDGANTDSADHRSHMAYPVKGACPADHPVLVPQVQLHVQWAIQDGASGAPLSLSSGSIYGMHAEFFDAWDTAGLKQLISSCIVAGISCHL